MPIVWWSGDGRNDVKYYHSRMPRLRAESEKGGDKMSGVVIFVLFGLIALYAREVEKYGD